MKTYALVICLALIFTSIFMPTAYAASALDDLDYMPLEYMTAAPLEALLVPATKASSDMTYSNACVTGKKTIIAAVGDVLMHAPLQRQGFASDDHFKSLFSDVIALLKKGDITYANLEGPVAGPVSSSGKEVPDPGMFFDGVAYTTYPMFNYHPQIITDLKESGIDIVSTANNHAMDRRTLGVDRTIENLNAARMPFSGTRSTKKMDRPWWVVTQVGDLQIAWLACTFSTNGLADKNRQVLMCFEQADEIVALIASLKDTKGVDAVIVTPHWGVEYTHTPGKDQKDLAHRFLNAGALAVLGSHPHVLQPWEKYMTLDGRETFVIYSFGNFISGQKELAKRTTLILYLGLTKTAAGKTVINGVRYVPLEMKWGKEITLRPAGDDAHKLVLHLFGEDRVMNAVDAVVTNPECRGAY